MFSLLRKIISSHRTVYLSIGASVLSAVATAAASQLQNDQLNYRAILGAGATVLLTALAGYAKSPATPKQDPPVEDGKPGGVPL